MDVTIGRCTAGEIDDVVRFINVHWKPGHILAACRPLLDWQYRETDGSGYGFILARRRNDGAVLGILGYIATRRFDPSLASTNVLWLTTWKVRDDAGVSGLGIQLLEYLRVNETHQAIGAIGLTPSTLPLYRTFGFAVGEMQHYVRPNPNNARFELASLTSQRRSVSLDQSNRSSWKRLVTDDDFAALRFSPNVTTLPVKSPEYFRRRYGRHPIYRYIVEALVGPSGVVALLAMRIAEHSGKKALRVVDYAGPAAAFAAVGSIFNPLLEEFDAEYADVYNAGIAARVFMDAGFRPVDPDGPEIVPDHFEPFERKNIRLWYACKGTTPVLFKGDADQDRPNQVTEARR